LEEELQQYEEVWLSKQEDADFSNFHSQHKTYSSNLKAPFYKLKNMA